MAAPQPTAPVRQLPPELPHMPEAGPTLSNYLRTLSLWAKREFENRLSNTSAEPTVLLQAADAAPGTTPAVFKVQVKSDGTLQSIPVGLGSGGEGSAISSSGALPLTGGTLTGPLNFTPLPINAATDAAAATAGVPIGGTYRNGSILMVRVA